MKLVPISRKYVVLVDDEDFEEVSKFKWTADKRRGGQIYAYRTIKGPNRSQTKLYLHRFLLPAMETVDHRNGDGLDNQKHNLRPATDQQNNQSFKRKRAGASSQYRGVCWANIARKFRAVIFVEGKHIYLGGFDKEEDAARAYDAAARKYFGEYAAPNFP